MVSLMFVTKSGWRLYGVQVKNVDVVWPSIKPLLKKLMETREFCSSEKILKEKTKQAKYQMWLAFDPTGTVGMLAFSTIIKARRITSFRMLYASGHDFIQWNDFWPAWEAWAKSLGCNALEIEGRAGWERVKKPLGFRKKIVLLRKKIW